MIKKIPVSVTALLLIFILIFTFFLLRLTSQKELDDISPGIPCEQKLLQKSDVLWVIPNYNNVSIDENPEWCAYIKSLNKTLGLHGVYHTYKEFQTDRNQQYLEQGINAFEKCFGFKPKMFKAPQLAISSSNKELIKNNNMQLKGRANQVLHKVYHCSDSGLFSNKFNDWF